MAAVDVFMGSSGGICSFSFDLRLTEITYDDDQQSNAKPVGELGRPLEVHPPGGFGARRSEKVG